MCKFRRWGKKKTLINSNPTLGSNTINEIERLKDLSNQWKKQYTIQKDLSNVSKEILDSVDRAVMAAGIRYKR